MDDTEYLRQLQDHVIDVKLTEPAKPRDHSRALDAEIATTVIDLLQFVDDDHILKRLSLAMAEAFHMPASTIFVQGLGIYSGMSCRKWRVGYRDGYNFLPISLNVATTHPPGTGKGRVQNVFTKPFKNLHSQVVQDRKRELAELLAKKESFKSSKDGLSEYEEERLRELQSSPAAFYFVTNATTEAIEEILSPNKGFYLGISSEQGLFNSLLGKAYSNGTNNNDLVLLGFDGAFHNSKRVGCGGYSGTVVGAIISFAQSGSILTLLEIQGIGVPERFIMLEEPHQLGRRNHLKKTFVDKDLILEYETRCQFASTVFTSPEDYDDLCFLKISEAGFDLIAKFQNEIEPHLADGAKFSHLSLRGAASKIDMQVMKIAANLHLLSSKSPGFEIPDKYIKAAIGIAKELLRHQYRLMVDKGLIGLKAEWQAVLNMFDDIKNPVLTGLQIRQSRRKVKPFSDMKNPSEKIDQHLTEMVKAGLLEIRTEGKKTFYSLGQ